MPIMTCRKDNKPGYKWGKSGYCYTYTNNAASREAAKKKAIKQGRAIEANK